MFGADLGREKTQPDEASVTGHLRYGGVECLMLSQYRLDGAPFTCRETAAFSRLCACSNAARFLATVFLADRALAPA